jgi:hypothetical protein
MGCRETGPPSGLIAAQGRKSEPRLVPGRLGLTIQRVLDLAAFDSEGLST